MKNQAIDPVCHMVVSEESTVRTDYEGRIYYFCCASCRESFLLIRRHTWRKKQLIRSVI